MWSAVDRLGAAPASLVGGGDRVLLGLCVQTLVTSVFAAGVVAVVALARIRRERWAEWRRAAAVLAGAARADRRWPRSSGTRCAARFAEFWGGWWIYGSYQSAGLGRSLFAQFGLAWDQAYDYYRTWPLSAAVLVVAAALAVARWPQLPPAQRAIRLGVAAWVLAAWVELALAQRYSSHYFSILALPTWLAAATAVADLRALAPPRTHPARAAGGAAARRGRSP